MPRWGASHQRAALQQQMRQMNRPRAGSRRRRKASIGSVPDLAKLEHRRNREECRKQPFQGRSEARAPKQIARKQIVDQLRLNGNPALEPPQRSLEPVPQTWCASANKHDAVAEDRTIDLAVQYLIGWQ